MRTAVLPLSLTLLTLVACGERPPVVFVSATGSMHGTLEVEVQGVPVRVVVDTEAAVEGGPVLGRAAVLTPLGGLECDLLPEHDCHPTPAAALSEREETGDE